MLLMLRNPPIRPIPLATARPNFTLQSKPAPQSALTMRPSHLHGAAVALLLLCVAAGVRGSTVSPSQGSDAGRVAQPAAAGAAAAIAGAAALPTPIPLDRPEDKACL